MIDSAASELAATDNQLYEALNLLKGLNIMSANSQQLAKRRLQDSQPQQTEE